MMKPRALICYSNPTGTGRLRLDIEHAQIESALASAGLDVGLVKRIHATRLEDLIDELASAEYEVLQFSGHGDEAGIYLENSARTGAQLVDAASLRKLLEIRPQHLRVVVLTCCFSEAYRAKLAACVPYLISVGGPAPDKAAIEFARVFYSQLWRAGQPIELAFRYAEMLAQTSGLSVQISRRGLIRDQADLRVEAQIELEIQSRPNQALEPTALRTQGAAAQCQSLDGRQRRRTKYPSRHRRTERGPDSRSTVPT